MSAKKINIRIRQSCLFPYLAADSRNSVHQTTLLFIVSLGLILSILYVSSRLLFHRNIHPYYSPPATTSQKSPILPLPSHHHNVLLPSHHARRPPRSLHPPHDPLFRRRLLNDRSPAPNAPLPHLRRPSNQTLRRRRQRHLYACLEGTFPVSHSPSEF